MTKLRSESMFQIDGFNAHKYIRNNYGSFATIDGSDIIVQATTGEDGWGLHTSEENAEYLIAEIKADGFSDIEKI